MPEGHAGRGRQRQVWSTHRRAAARSARSRGCQRRAAVATGRPATPRPRGSPCWRARRHFGMPALMGRGGQLCGHVLPRGSAIGHRAFAWVWGVAGARWSGVWARTAAGPCPFVLCLNQLQICLNRARPVELRLARWLDMGGGMSGAHRKPTGGTSLQVPGPSVHCGPMVPHPGGGEQKHGDRHRLGAVMGVLSHYLHWRQGAGTHPPEAHFAPGGRAARACGY